MASTTSLRAAPRAPAPARRARDARTRRAAANAHAAPRRDATAENTSSSPSSSSSSTPSRRALLLSTVATIPLLSSSSARAVEVNATTVTPVNAYIGLMDGRDAVRAMTRRASLSARSIVPNTEPSRRSIRPSPRGGGSSAARPSRRALTSRPDHLRPSTALRAPPRHPSSQIVSAMELQGLPEGGRRSRVMNLLPRYADKAKTMTAVLPVTIATSFGEVVDVGVGVDGDGDGAVPANGLGAMEDVLLGAKNLTVLAKYVADGTPFGEEEVPQASFAAAVEACDRIIEAAPADVMKKASGERCRRLISSAVDMEEMKTFAASPACDNYGK